MVYDLQKASLWKRFAAWLFDSILVGILVVGIAFLLSSALHYDQYSDKVTDTYAKYETEYGVTFNVSQQEYESWPETKRNTYDQAYERLINDEDAMYAYNMVVNLTMVISSLSILISVLALDFIVPLFFKNGQTFGKKIFGLCVVSNNCVKMKTVQLFARTILGKFAVETMIPVYILLMLFFGITDLTGTLVLGALLLIEIIVISATRHKAAIHDLLASTAVADYNSQMIFNTQEELIEFQKKVHAERAARQEY